MRWLLFLSRVAFICNLFFILSLLILWKELVTQQAVVGTVGILGYVLAIVFNSFVNLCYVTMLLVKRSVLSVIPKWLLLANLVFFILQILYIFVLNDTLHN